MENFCLAADEADDVLGHGEDRVGDGVRAASAIVEDAVDLYRVGHQALHLGPDGNEPRRGKLGKRLLELGEGGVAEVAQHSLLAGLGERRIDAYEIVGLDRKSG